MEKFLEHIPTILAVLFGISEALAYIPQVKSNSVFQASFSFLKKVAIITIHGVGDTNPNYHQSLQRKLRSYVGEDTWDHDVHF